MAADLQAIREATNMRQLVEQSGVKLRVYRGVATGCCPFHQEKTGSFRLNLTGPHAGKWRCHGACGIGGDCFDFVRRIDGIDITTAIRRLAAEAGIIVYDRPETQTERRQREADRVEKEICQWYFRQEWQKARRGLNRAMTAWAFGNQFADDIATIHGARLRWIERERGTALGLAEFRAARIPERRYREWMSGHLAQYAARLDFVALVLDNRMVG